MDAAPLERFLLVFSTLLVIVDPVGVVPSFISLTQNYSASEINRTVLKSTVAGTLVLLLFSLLGAHLFRVLGLNMDAFKIGGGLLLLITALEMLRGRAENCKRSPDEINASKEREDISFVPVAVPLLAGPGAITSIMVFSTDHDSSHVLQFSIVALAVVLTFVISYFVLRSSTVISKMLGRSGVSVVQRLMGLLLAALSIQFIFSGAVQLITQFS